MTDVLYRTLFDALPSHIAILDERGRIMATNRAWRAFAEDNGADWRDVSEGADYLAACDAAKGDAAEQAGEMARLIRSLLAGEREVFSLEYPCHAPERRRWFLCHGRRIPGTDPGLVLLMHEDISVAIHAREAERVLGGHSRALFDFAPDATLMVDDRGQIVLANRQAGNLFGYAPQDLVGAAVESLLPKADRARHAQLRGAYQCAPSFRRMAGPSGPLSALHRSGERIPVEISLGPLVTEEGTWTLAAVRDLRERIELESRLHQAERLETIGQLAGGVAHDFNNLLTIIGGTVGLVREAVEDNPAIHEDLETISYACEEAAHLTRTLLTFARQGPILPQSVSLPDFFRRKLPMVRRLIGEDIRLEVDVTDNHLELHLDPVHLEQVILNLAANSRDAMPDGGAIHIRIERVELVQDDLRRLPDMRSGPYAYLRFDDTGPGIAKDVLARIFDPFFTTKEHGTGLGLATVHGIVRQHLGHVWCESTPQRGASFMVLLPLRTPTGLGPG